MEGLTEGRIVHYVMEDGRHPGEHRAAVVVKDWKEEAGTVNLAVFVDGTNDYANIDVNLATSFMPVVWKTSRMYSEAKTPGTWHWIEKA